MKDASSDSPVCFGHRACSAIFDEQRFAKRHGCSQGALPISFWKGKKSAGPLRRRKDWQFRRRTVWARKNSPHNYADQLKIPALVGWKIETLRMQKRWCKYSHCITVYLIHTRIGENESKISICEMHRDSMKWIQRLPRGDPANTRVNSCEVPFLLG